ncbi:MAG: class I SAM-dependent methyltransferase [Nitrospirota bacterium]
MKYGEKLLFLLSRNPGNDAQIEKEGWTIDNAFSLLCTVFPDFMNEIVDKEILDFGCGFGWQVVAFAKHGAKYVGGVDTNETSLKKAKTLAMEFQIGEMVEFRDRLDESFQGRFDMVISQNSMEHFECPIEIINKMKWTLKKNGKIWITFGPPWFAPYGSHMHFFTKIPWVNIIFSEKTVMNVRKQFRNDGAIRYEEVESGLNKMTVSKFEQIISNSGLKIQYKKYDCVKGINWLGKIPFVRELFINRVSCILTQ